ncbi:polyglutamine-binding protein 1 isoform X1 [Athalia rosae]|uniref:polyglutamine-binding protein 1 isoform X1 n=1 Tax=Athalia rosae TaxID=37344 RepID=UPI0020339968|nr:polyglutamine-binding protein 1 isoform X1 [Athalia rosae]XP_048514173.1 polyglutamine-binding protein 1 isoform X1 [Athalia rosae]
MHIYFVIIIQNLSRIRRLIKEFTTAPRDKLLLMPLPAALAARLAKRGLISGGEKHESPSRDSKKKIHEEIIAEDYDNAKDDINQIDILQKFMGYSGCPNKYNIYHECNSKCKDLWGAGHLQPTEKYLKRQTQLLQKYPLPETWKAVFDPGSGQHYYWEWSSDLVSWFPPGHPKCQISQPASQLREELHLKAADQDDNMSSDESASDQETMEIDEVETKRDQKIETRVERYKGSENRRVQRHDSSKDKKDRSLDPMDPASYSDIPRGKWSDGLARHNEAKTGADTTASGPLYQMRPYPSPGAVLRSNKNSKPEAECSVTTKPKVSFPEKPE